MKPGRAEVGRVPVKLASAHAEVDGIGIGWVTLPGNQPKCAVKETRNTANLTI